MKIFEYLKTILVHLNLTIAKGWMLLEPRRCEWVGDVGRLKRIVKYINLIDGQNSSFIYQLK